MLSVDIYNTMQFLDGVCVSPHFIQADSLLI